ncbi:hypothetical protein OC846_002519, partial [Tilletia horrida]
MRFFVPAALLALASLAVAKPVAFTCDCIIETPEGPKSCCPPPSSSVTTSSSSSTTTHLTIVPPRLPTGGFSTTKSKTKPHHKTTTTSQSIYFSAPTVHIPIPINPTTGKPLK